MIVQAPAPMLQQAPVGSGCGHWFGEQFVPAACQMLGNSHAASVVTVQVPAEVQHAAVATHGFGEQIVPAVCQVLPGVHPA